MAVMQLFSKARPVRHGMCDLSARDLCLAEYACKGPLQLCFTVLLVPIVLLSSRREYMGHRDAVLAALKKATLLSQQLQVAPGESYLYSNPKPCCGAAILCCMPRNLKALLGKASTSTATEGAAKPQAAKKQKTGAEGVLKAAPAARLADGAGVAVPAARIAPAARLADGAGFAAGVDAASAAAAAKASSDLAAGGAIFTFGKGGDEAPAAAAPAATPAAPA
eukprot:scaffold171288_cov15-Tisochrysis_lutea.AAC.1